MSKEEKEVAIIEGIKNLKWNGCGGYQYLDKLEEIIAKVMGYKYYVSNKFSGYYVSMDTIDENRKVWEIIERMYNKNIIKISKSGFMFKLNIG